MRFNTMIRWLVCGVGVSALVLAIGVQPLASTTQCEQDCMDQFDADVQECDDELAAKQADLAQQELDCMDSNNGDPPGLQGCLNSVAVQQRNAVKQHQQCLKRADTKLRNCLKKCDASPS